MDYRALNKITVKNKYPRSLIEDLFNLLAKATYFSKLDLRSSYWQVRITERDEPKMTCVTRYGSYEFLILLLGLTDSSMTFFQLMNQVFYDYIDDFVVVYLDDVVVFSESLEDHISHLKLVLSRLQAHKFVFKFGEMSIHLRDDQTLSACHFSK